ncbi:MAG: VanZ family protein [bacterium]|nr:VanZ family protein [bacterium]
MTLRGWRILLVVWMGLIFLISSNFLNSQMSADATKEVFGTLNYVVRKSAHLSEYALLAFLWMRSIWVDPERFRSSLIWSVVFTVLYAATDEFHQSFVPNRLGIWTDVIFDATGAVLMVCALWWIKNKGSERLRRGLLGTLAEK